MRSLCKYHCVTIVSFINLFLTSVFDMISVYPLVFATVKGLVAKCIIRRKVKIECLPVLCCYVVDNSTLKVFLAQNALSAVLCRAEVAYLWQNALSVTRKI